MGSNPSLGIPKVLTKENEAMFVLTSNGDAEIKVQDDEGKLLGTVVITKVGVLYRKPHQRDEGSVIPYSLLAKLSA